MDGQFPYIIRKRGSLCWCKTYNPHPHNGKNISKKTSMLAEIVIVHAIFVCLNLYPLPIKKPPRG